MFRRLITPAYLGGVSSVGEAMALVTDTLFPSAYLAETVLDPDNDSSSSSSSSSSTTTGADRITRRVLIERRLLQRASVGRRQTLAGMIAQSAAATCVALPFVLCDITRLLTNNLVRV